MAMSGKNKQLVTMVTILVLTVALYGTYKLINSRTHQMFGEIISRVDTDEKVIALTFDDSPTAYTDEVLNVLEQKQIHATFYTIGQQMEKYPDVAKRIAAAGNELGSHTYSHQRMIFKSQKFIDAEIQKTNTLIREAGFEGEITFRPPNSKKLIGLPWYLARQTIKTITADVEPDTYGATTDFFVEYTLEHAKPGSIILLHPFCEMCSEQRKAIPLIIDALAQKGYRFVTISELLKEGGIQ